MMAVLSVVLTLVAAGDLVFRRNDGSSKGLARVAIVLLLSAYAFAIAPFGIGVANSHPAATLLIAFAAAFISLLAALFTRGWFRLFAACAAVSLLVLIVPVLAFVGSGQGVR